MQYPEGTLTLLSGCPVLCTGQGSAPESFRGLLSLGGRMKVMFIITLLSFAALAGAAFAIFRRIRKRTAVQSSGSSEAELSQAIEERLSGLSKISDRKADHNDLAYRNKEQNENRSSL